MEWEANETRIERSDWYLTIAYKSPPITFFLMKPMLSIFHQRPILIAFRLTFFKVFTHLRIIVFTN